MFMVKLLLFDVDGTVLLSNGVGGRAMTRAGKRLFGSSFTFEVDTSGMLDPHIYRDLVTANPHLDMDAMHDMFRDTYVETLESELVQPGSHAYALLGIEDLLATLRTFKYLTLGLLTGNYAPAAALKFRSAGLAIDQFPVTAFGDEAATRRGLVQVALQKYLDLEGERLEPHQVVVIGDTPKDIDCALANGCVAFGVATGRYSADELRTAGAEVVVESLLEPSPLLDLLATPASS